MEVSLKGLMFIQAPFLFFLLLINHHSVTVTSGEVTKEMGIVAEVVCEVCIRDGSDGSVPILFCRICHVEKLSFYLGEKCG